MLPYIRFTAYDIITVKWTNLVLDNMVFAVKKYI